MVSINFNNRNLWTGLNINDSTTNREIKEEKLTLNANTGLDGFVKSVGNNAKKQACWGFKETKDGLFCALVEEKNGRFIITVTRANGKDILVTEINIKFKSEKDAQKYLDKNGFTTEAF